MNKFTSALTHIKCLSGNQLKIIALITMTLDHVGLQLLPQYPILRVIGRLAMPLFAYMIAEGCRYTRNRSRYLLSIASMATVCQLVYFFAMGSLYQCILVTFSLSICLIYVIDIAKSKGKLIYWLTAIATTVLVIFICTYLPVMLAASTDFAVDYGIWGVLLAVFIYFAPDRFKVLATALALIPLSITYGGVQWYCLISCLLLLLYSGKRGKAPMKNLFYIYYPTHLVVIYFLSLL